MSLLRSGDRTTDLVEVSRTGSVTLFQSKAIKSWHGYMTKVMESYYIEHSPKTRMRWPLVQVGLNLSSPHESLARCQAVTSWTSLRRTSSVKSSSHKPKACRTQLSRVLCLPQETVDLLVEGIAQLVRAERLMEQGTPVAEATAQHVSKYGQTISK